MRPCRSRWRGRSTTCPTRRSPRRSAICRPARVRRTYLLASFGSSGTLAFCAAVSVSTGYYLVRSRSSSGTLSAGGKWLRVDQDAKTVPVVPPAQHNMANLILPGQTVTGTFAEGGDTSGQFGDYNTFFFFGTAGTVIDASVTRVDTSKPWEDPSALDPQLEIIAPDGLIYDNLRRVDDQPGVDYDASLTGAVLPLTGTYYLRAATLKGSGQFQASLSYTSVAPAPSGRARSRSSATTTPSPSTRPCKPRRSSSTRAAIRSRERTSISRSLPRPATRARSSSSRPPRQPPSPTARRR